MPIRVSLGAAAARQAQRAIPAARSFSLSMLSQVGLNRDLAIARRKCRYVPRILLHDGRPDRVDAATAVAPDVEARGAIEEHRFDAVGEGHPGVALWEFGDRRPIGGFRVHTGPFRNLFGDLGALDLEAHRVARIGVNP